MKNLGAVRDKVVGILKPSQTKYIKKFLEKFRMEDAKPKRTPLGSHLRLSNDQSHKKEEDKEEMTKFPYV